MFVAAPRSSPAEASAIARIRYEEARTAGLFNSTARSTADLAVRTASGIRPSASWIRARRDKRRARWDEPAIVGAASTTSVASSETTHPTETLRERARGLQLDRVVRNNDRGPQNRFRFGETSVFNPGEPEADRRAGGCNVARLARSFERRRRAIDVPTLQCEKPQAKRGLCERLHRSPATEQADGSR